MKEIQLTDENDLALASITQGALVNNTVMPSGFKTPSENMIIRGTKLVLPTENDRMNFDLDRRR